jgi:hypothetical protein
MIRTLALVTLLASSTLVLAAAQNSVYKWKDAGGAVHYSDAPPPMGTSFTKVKAGITSAGAPPTDTAAPAPVADPADSDKSAGADTAAKKQTQAQANVKLCEQARANVKLLQGAGTLNISRDGKVEPLPDVNRAGELKRAQAAATLYCS